MGDVDGDGYDDIAIGASFASPAGRYRAGSTYVIRGSAAATDLSTASLGARGFRIDGADASGYSGSAVAGADLDGDGLSEVLVGVPDADHLGRQAGAVAVEDLDL